MKKANKLIAFRMTDWEYSQLLKALKITNQENKSRFIVTAVLEKIQKIVDKEK